MKISKYNISFEYNGRHYIFNQMSAALREVDKELWTSLRFKASDIPGAEVVDLR